jgi:hypothetical protein
MELIGVFPFDSRYGWRIMVDVFISLESSLLVSRALASIFRQRTHGDLQHANAKFTTPTN